MADDVLIIGDGPGGLSAALFLAKNGKQVRVLGIDKTPMHKAMLYNYPGIPEITGSDWQARTRRQVESFGATIDISDVKSVAKTDQGFVAVTSDGARHEGRFVILANGSKGLVDGLGAARDADGGYDVDLYSSRTSVDGAYLVGWLVRKDRCQAVIAAGDGAAAALDILSTLAGKDVHDFDVV